MDCAIINIPTLNRARHLKRCLDSLANNGWAKYSPIHISVDYPPSPKYEQGYIEVLSLLETYDFSCFKSVEVYRQRENLGPSRNLEFLLDHCENRIILTEDDNEFSPNFLEYINKGLDLYEENDQVYSINGMADTKWYCDERSNVLSSKLFPAYGYGSWLGKKISIDGAAQTFLLDRNNWTVKNFCFLWKRNSYLFAAYLLQIICANRGIYWSDGKLSMADIPLSIYMHLTDIVCIVPIKSKSRTFGNDGSGVNMPIRKDNGLKEIDTNNGFEFNSPEPLKFDKRNYKIGEKYLDVSFPNALAKFKMQIKAVVCLILLYVYGKDREKVIKIVNRFRKAI